MAKTSLDTHTAVVARLPGVSWAFLLELFIHHAWPTQQGSCSGMILHDHGFCSVRVRFDSHLY